MSPPIIFLIIVILAVLYFRSKKKSKTAAAAPAPKPAPAPKQKKPAELEDWIFSPDPVPEEILDELEDEEVELVQEPTNAYDKNAVMVMFGDVKLGYLFKGRLQDAVNKAIRSGSDFSAYVIDVNREAPDGKKIIQIVVNFE